MIVALRALQHADTGFPSGGFAFSQGLEAMVRARGDVARLRALDDAFEASLFVEGLRIGSRRNGNALLAAHCRLGTDGAAEYQRDVNAGAAPDHLAVVQGLVWSALDLDEATSLAMSGYVFVSGIVQAAVRLGLIGAIGGQAILGQSLPRIAVAAVAPVADDAPFSGFAPLADITVCRHGRTAGAVLFAN